MTNEILVFVTCGTRREANRLARELVRSKLAACVNIFPNPVQSIYRWKGQVEIAKETLLLIKSSRARFRKLEREIRRVHSYEVPEIIALPIVTGSEPYLRWMRESVRSTRKSRGRVRPLNRR
jgi:periplasmic divalent cation tolerance protein